MELLHQFKLFMAVYCSFLVFFALLVGWILYPKLPNRSDRFVICLLSLVFTFIIWGFLL